MRRRLSWHHRGKSRRLGRDVVARARIATSSRAQSRPLAGTRRALVAMGRRVCRRRRGEPGTRGGRLDRGGGFPGRLVDFLW